jgi:predicted metalloprotease with PDZ domain
MRANKDFFDARIAEKRPGQLVNLTIFRFDDLSMLPIKLAGRIPPAYQIVPVANPSEEQKKIYQSWLAGPPSK